MIRPMLAADEKAVREILALCYPTFPTPAESWYFANPTLVAVEGEEIAGFASFTVTVMPGFGRTMYGQHVCIHPNHRGKGLASILHQARLDVARDVECNIFIGVAQPTNKAMVKIFEESGLHQCVPGSEDSYLYVGAINGRHPS